MTKEQLVKAVKARTRYKQHDIENILFATIEAASEALEYGDEVILRGFGRFKVVEKAARKARNPRTGETIIIPPQNVPVFVPAVNLRKKVNKNG